MTAPPIGRVVATELKPSTPHQFHFWTALESPIGIGAIVRVEEAGRTVYGVVTDGFAYSDLVTPMHDVLGADGDPVAAGLEPTARAEIRLYTAAVLRQIPEEPLQPVPIGAVWLADEADVVLALRMDGYMGGERPPASRSASTRPAGSSRRSTSTATFSSAPRRRTSTSPACPGSRPRPARSSCCSSSIFQTFPGTRDRSPRSAST